MGQRAKLEKEIMRSPRQWFVVSGVPLGKGYHSPTESMQGQPCMFPPHRWSLHNGDLLRTLNIQILHLSQARCVKFGTFLLYFLHIVLSFLVKGSFIDFFSFAIVIWNKPGDCHTYYLYRDTSIFNGVT